MSVAENVAIGKEVRDLQDMLEEWDDARWIRLRDEILKRYPLPAPAAKHEMDYQAAIAYGHTLMNFGKYNGTPIREVPISYLQWLCREQEDFYGQLRAYLRSEVGKARQDEGETDDDIDS